MTKQSFVQECDINNILKEYKVTGQIRHMSAKAAAGAYQDLPEPMDFQEALHTMQSASSAFDTLPSQVRRRFGNDPGQFLAFMADSANLEEARSLGLMNAPAAPERRRRRNRLPRRNKRVQGSALRMLGAEPPPCRASEAPEKGPFLSLWIQSGLK